MKDKYIVRQDDLTDCGVSCLEEVYYPKMRRCGQSGRTQKMWLSVLI